jgi:hypothetical protein
MTTRFFIALAAGVLAAGTVHAETKTYTGMGNVVRQELTMNLGNGQTVFSARSEGMATLSTEPPALLEVKCMGLGLIAVADDVETDIYCTFRKGSDDAFDLKAKSSTKGGTAKVIGGSGKWKGATGTATFERLSTTENGGSFSYKMTITTP